MKRILLSFVVLLVSLSMSAQGVNYANMIKLSKMKSVSEIGSTLKSIGYRLEQTVPGDGCEIYAWGYGTAKFDSVIGDWKYYGTDWAICLYMNFEEGGGIIHFNFPSSATFSQVKNQLKSAGWKLVDEYTNEVGINALYKKDGTYNYFTLTENANKDDGFAFVYTWY